jgi:hypothetical protein
MKNFLNKFFVISLITTTIFLGKAKSCTLTNKTGFDISTVLEVSGEIHSYITFADKNDFLKCLKSEIQKNKSLNIYGGIPQWFITKIILTVNEHTFNISPQSLQKGEYFLILSQEKQSDGKISWLLKISENNSGTSGIFCTAAS